MKKTKVEINISENIKNKVMNLKEKSIRVINKIKTNLKENKGKRLTKQSVKYYSLLILMIAVAVISTYENIKEYQQINTEEYENHKLDNENIEANSSNIVTDGKEENDINKENKVEIKEENTAVDTSPYKTAISSISTNVENVKNEKENFPVQGKIVQEFSQDNVVYYESLGVWKTHGGVDISCEKNEQVLCVLEGKVVGIYQDEVFGNSVVVENEEYVAVYSSLDSNILVDIGDVLEKGVIIGTAGTNPAEENHGVHLHFELMKDGEYVNPSLIGIK